MNRSSYSRREPWKPFNGVFDRLTPQQYYELYRLVKLVDRMRRAAKNETPRLQQGGFLRTGKNFFQAKNRSDPTEITSKNEVLV